MTKSDDRSVEDAIEDMAFTLSGLTPPEARTDMLSAFAVVKAELARRADESASLRERNEVLEAERNDARAALQITYAHILEGWGGCPFFDKCRPTNPRCNSDECHAIMYAVAHEAAEGKR